MDYTVCNNDRLYAHLQMCFSDGGFYKGEDGKYHSRIPCELLREEVDSFVDACNRSRLTSDGYERVEDCDGNEDVITFYVMCEDGNTMCEMLVMFDREAITDSPSSMLPVSY